MDANSLTTPFVLNIILVLIGVAVYLAILKQTCKNQISQIKSEARRQAETTNLNPGDARTTKNTIPYEICKAMQTLDLKNPPIRIADIKSAFRSRIRKVHSADNASEKVTEVVSARDELIDHVSKNGPILFAQAAEIKPITTVPSKAVREAAEKKIMKQKWSEQGITLRLMNAIFIRDPNLK